MMATGSLERIETTLEFDPETGDYRRKVAAESSDANHLERGKTTTAGKDDTTTTSSSIMSGGMISPRIGRHQMNSTAATDAGYSRAASSSNAPVHRMPSDKTASSTSMGGGGAPMSSSSGGNGNGGGDGYVAAVVDSSSTSTSSNYLERMETTLEFDPETGDYRRVTVPFGTGSAVVEPSDGGTYQTATEMSNLVPGGRGKRSSSFSSNQESRNKLQPPPLIQKQHVLLQQQQYEVTAQNDQEESQAPRSLSGGGGKAFEGASALTDNLEYDLEQSETKSLTRGGRITPIASDLHKSPGSPDSQLPTITEGETFLDQASRRLFGLAKAPTLMEMEIEQRISPLTRKVRYFFRNVMFESIWLILILLGSIMSIFAWCIDEVTELLVDWRGDIAKLKHPNPERHPWMFTTWARDLDQVSSFFVWWMWALVMGFGGVLVVRHIGPQAAGSGIEQVRSIQTGYSIPGYLEVNTLIAKVVGLILTQASGLTIGKEGPFVHISCSLANLLLSMPLFSDVKASKHLTKTVIAAACATGVSSTFGAPVGGVLFAIEVTSSVFHTSDYWKSFFCAVVGEMVFRELSYFGTARSSQISLFPTTFRSQPYLLSELPVFLILAAMCGLYGGFYVKWIIGVRTWRQQQLSLAEQWHAKMNQPGGFESALELELENRLARSGTIDHAYSYDDEETGLGDRPRRLSEVSRGSFTFASESGGTPRGRRFDVFGMLAKYDAFIERRNVRVFLFHVKHIGMRLARLTLRPNGWAFTVISLTAIMDFVTGDYMARSLYAAINDLLVSGQMAADSEGPVDPRVLSVDWGNPSLFIALIWYFVSKSFLCVLALSLAVPTGTLIPMLAIGLSMGRIWGELMQNVGGANFAPGGYAMVGAAAFIAGATGAISTAVIIFEITSQLSYMVPILLAVILGRAAGKVISPDLYEALQISKKLPNIPPLAHQSSYKVLCMEVMNPKNIPMISRFTTPSNVAQILQKRTYRHHDEVADDDLFCIVDPHDNLYLGSVARHQLKALLLSFSGADRTDEPLDILSVCNANAIAPSVPITTPLSDVLFLFEITLCSTLFVTDHSRVVGWLDLSTVRHKCESGEL